MLKNNFLINNVFKTKGNLKNLIKNFFLKLGYFLFFMMLFVPITYKTIKAAILMFIFVVIIIKIITTGRIAIHPKVLLWVLLLIIVGFLFVILGIIHNNPGALRVSTVHILWPFVYLVLISELNKREVLLSLMRILVLATIFISGYSFDYIFYAKNLIPQIMYFPINQGQAISFGAGSMEFRLYSLASLLFLIPFIISALFVWDNKMVISRIWLWLALIMSLPVVFLSGRRALILVTLISPLVILFFYRFLPLERKKIFFVKKIITLTILICFFLSIILYFFFSFYWKTFISYFLKGFDFGNNPSAHVRFVQFIALLNEWKETPIFGAGLGATAKGCIRDPKMPWAYELYFLSLLFQVGIIGILFYSAFIVWLVYSSIKIIRYDKEIGIYLLSVMSGTISFLIAANTNPYLGKFDYLWVIFLPLAFVNYNLLKPKVLKF